MIVILMGVTGSGKSTVAERLVKRTDWKFAEGDSYHSEANKKKMAAGVPLTDADREPWLEALHGVMEQWWKAGESGVMTCSALKASYRQILQGDLPANAVRFVLLEVPEAQLQERLAHRAGHYMNPVLLKSQLATLEDPGTSAVHIDATRSPDEVAEAILRELAAVPKA